MHFQSRHVLREDLTTVRSGPPSYKSELSTRAVSRLLGNTYLESVPRSIIDLQHVNQLLAGQMPHLGQELSFDEKRRRVKSSLSVPDYQLYC